VSLSADGETTGGSLYLLAALTMLTMTFSPFAASAALRISAD
jgi:ABC-type transport system involved in cytochrome c biogenesis permease component